MKMPKRLIAGAAVLMLCASPLLQVMADERGGYDRGGPQQGHRDNRGNEHRGPGDDRRGGPPRDFGPVRQTIRDNHGYFVRGAPPPPGIHLVRGQPLPRGYYGERLEPRALSRLPVYPGYEWRRMGGDIVLIAVGTGIVYEILDGVLY
ncbi:regulator RcnB of Ni and Co efflux [Pseudomonas sp. NFPP10]|uniref:anti-virulence regulator CigR family protein n=1 Tax=unclassified Pseudomonas TaxID=196821 RepID=UPI00088DE703|nr:MULTISPECIES: anti-virulence regulator CigR family protein [unclassified Pseudomonas]SDA30386.1 regulator RcnB of Ni and Co efflux [Pseudomonas sp. NFPP12]SEM04191.1 regulator RcnB of Ni and Co efflux [Pseudomonas sp. NFPP10]SEQ88266.1 regulator RcnB of Ni and Co efflux [Pseudomonas sp. NFPP19]SFJ99373.1 regulator RcnB of Ni and Co efflux [Pseudomonas sp. NFPP08]SFN19960.1 regulator RcnB of Ni and Co efflux [Pseudomonas sp. NFPP05]